MKRLIAALLLTLALPAGAQTAPWTGKLFDAHLHYNWEPKPYYPLEQVLALFREHGVGGILATSRPNDGTRALVEAKPVDVWVVPFIRPYVVRADIQSWFNDPARFELVETEYRRGYYRGIGEFHLNGRAAAGTAWVKRHVDFAVEHGLYLHAHADDEALETLYAHNPKARIIWAHTGFSTAPEKVEVYLKRYPALWCELSYRYGLTAGDGRLTPEWKALFERYPDRFLIGSDTWIDERWAGYGGIIAAYRGWLGQLDPKTAAMIGWGNGERLFGR